MWYNINAEFRIMNVEWIINYSNYSNYLIKIFFPNRAVGKKWRKKYEKT